MSDYQRGYVDGIAKAQEFVAAVKGRYGNGGMLGAAAQEALEEIAQLLDAARDHPQ